jgi:hypothetical protein
MLISNEYLPVIQGKLNGANFYVCILYVKYFPTGNDWALKVENIQR